GCTVPLIGCTVPLIGCTVPLIGCTVPLIGSSASGTGWGTSPVRLPLLLLAGGRTDRLTGEGDSVCGSEGSGGWERGGSARGGR
ncbi:MAG: hypothetical protein CMM85_03690, partial [Rhodothermaceae bacterium]|nr:hypothetical protein [Rhodothermaceae bacterium]